MNTLREIETYLNKIGWSTDSIDATYLNVSERGSGNGTDCEVDPAVAAAAREIRTEIRQRWPNTKCTLEAVDEWVHISIKLLPHES